ncbi:MarR family winged helix-turn-helix transcriptional regulator [Curtobacterium pusillum]|uniref:MarR family winged helix-turn-helix transcriptional regulator n=1 Tax=Curtobacterium pusillum TaxID=69373 RepID=UPI00382947E0
MSDELMSPPARLRALVQWQAGKVATVGARLTATRMTLGGRAEFAVLAALEEFGAMSQADLGRRLGLDRNDVADIVGRLDPQRHVDRQPDPSDRRRNIVSITASGRRHLSQLEQIASDVQDELLHGLGDEDREVLRALLARVLQRHGPQSS